jgi:hypothetical protein
MKMKLSDLIERVEAATGPDRELDYRLAYFLGWRFSGFEWAKQSRDQDWLSDDEFATLDEMAGGWKRPDQKEWPYPGTNTNEVPLWTASLDAAIGLVERVLPGWAWDVEGGGLRNHAHLLEPPKTPKEAWQGQTGQFGATPAIALMLALLHALTEEGETP